MHIKINLAMRIFSFLSVRSAALTLLQPSSSVSTINAAYSCKTISNGSLVFKVRSTTQPLFSIGRRPHQFLFYSYHRRIMKNRIQLRASSSDHPGKVIPTESYQSTTSVTDDGNDISHRKSLLHEKLLELDCFVDEADLLNFEYVVQQSMIDPTLPIYLPLQNADNDINGETIHNGISGMQKYGKSTIKTCQTFYYPKTNGTRKSHTDVTWKIAAARTARQIQFLYQRHKAQQTQWIRNHDILPPPPSSVAQNSASDSNSITVFDDTTISSDSSSVPRSKYHPFVVVLDNLRSAQNVGSIYRTADATKCQNVITIGITPNPGNGNGIHKVQKSSLGAELYVPTRHFLNATMALQYIYHAYPSYQIICVETTSESIPYTELHFEGRQDGGNSKHDGDGMVFIFGNEVTGVDVSLYMSQIAKWNKLSSPTCDSDNNMCGTKDHDDDSSPPSTTLTSISQLEPIITVPKQKILRVIEIPMYGTKNSLNVAVCVSIILYEMIRQYNTMSSFIERAIDETHNDET